MEYSTGKLASIFLFATMLSVLGAWLVAWRFRVAMRRWMSRPVTAAPLAAPCSLSALSPAMQVSAADNRRAGVRLTGIFIGLSILIALSSAAMQLALMHENLLTFGRTLTIALAYLWPVIPVLGQMWRWSRLRVLGVLLLWCLGVVAVLIWRQIDHDPQQAVVFLAWEVGPSILLVVLLCMGNATRAIAPLLLLPFLGLVWAMIAGMDLLDATVNQHPAWFTPLSSLAETLHSPALFSVVIIVAFVALPCVLAWWPMKWLAHRVASAYTRRWLSELLILFTLVWAISLLARALGWVPTLGFGAVLMLLPLLWIPAVILPLGHLRRSTGRPPTLLVLRVFQRDRAVRALFDTVIERWRLSGNTVLIAGTDLIERTLDAGDIFSFIDGELGQRFISSVDQIPERIAGFDLAPDAEARYRINECYCHDSTWREALAALLTRSDIVLMDLRGFQRRNQGCAFELGELAHAPALARVVVLVDAQTDIDAAKAATADAPSNRFLWLDAGRMNRARRREVLNALFVDATAVQPAQPFQSATA